MKSVGRLHRVWSYFTDTFLADAVAPPVTGIFGVPLATSIKYAHVAISQIDETTGQPYTYGYVPIIVAKCGVFLKEKGEHDPANIRSRV